MNRGRASIVPWRCGVCSVAGLGMFAGAGPAMAQIQPAGAQWVRPPRSSFGVTEVIGPLDRVPDQTTGRESVTRLSRMP
jgi:hypothetical protein